MNRAAFDAGVSHLLNSFAAARPKDDVVNTWYQHLQDIPGKHWTMIIRRLVADLDSFPRNLTRAVMAYVEPPKKFDLSVPINPDTGEEYTGRECYDNLRRLEELKRVMANHESPTRRLLLACEQACAKAGDDTVTLRRYGAHIIEALDHKIAKSDARQGVEAEREEVPA